MIEAEQLRDILEYTPETGIFRWRRQSGRRRAGEVAGKLNKEGYRDITIDWRRYVAHRLAWLYVHGRWPSDLIDHRDGNRDNNAINNLREATRAQNNFNRRGYSRLGAKGVSLNRGRFYYAHICHQGKNRHLGSFATLEAAAAAYEAAAKAAFGEFTYTATKTDGEV